MAMATNRKSNHKICKYIKQKHLNFFAKIKKTKEKLLKPFEEYAACNKTNVAS
jgi:hypothetical protein